MNKHIIGGVEFSDEIYKKLINNYSESFTHISLSIEKEFIKLEKYDQKINNLVKNEIETYNKLSTAEKENIIKKYHYFVTYMAYYEGMIPKIDFNNQTQIDEAYEKDFKDFDSYMTYLLVFDEKDNFLFNKTGKKVSEFFPLYISIKPIIKRARHSRRSHIEGFKYALNLEKLEIKNIIKINEIINKSNPDIQTGFKKVNNSVIGAPLETTKKEEIPVQMAELLYKYNNNFDMDIKDPSEDNITDEERYKRLFMICLKEARFHIIFEHIHPFADGNGRTGRIIMSTNLLKQHLAPPLITHVMLEQYKNFINNYDYQNLAQMIFDSSSQTLSSWVSIKREQEGIALDDIIDNKSKISI